MGALALDVLEKVASQLTRVRDADDGAEVDGGAGPEWQRARHPATHAIAIHCIVREWMLECEVCVSNDNRRAAHGSRRHRIARVEVEQGDLVHRYLSTQRAQRDFLANVARSIAQYSTPHCLDAAGRILKRHRHLMARELLGPARRGGVRGQYFCPRRRCDAHLACLNRGLVRERQGKCLCRYGEGRVIEHVGQPNRTKRAACSGPDRSDGIITEREIIRRYSGATWERCDGSAEQAESFCEATAAKAELQRAESDGDPAGPVEEVAP